jgi:acyl-CoA dehydrogenase
MTEPQAADPSLFTARAVRDGDEWVIDGEKWFSSSFERSAFIIVMAVTDADVSVYQGTSMFLVPAGTPGMEIVRRTGMGFDAAGTGSLHRRGRRLDARLPRGHGASRALRPGRRLRHGRRRAMRTRRCGRSLLRHAV